MLLNQRAIARRFAREHGTRYEDFESDYDTSWWRHFFGCTS